MRGDTDTVLDALERAAPHFDAAFVRGRDEIRPSNIMIIRYCMLMSSDDDQQHREAQRLAGEWLAEGRRRWRLGFAANPLSAEPQPRP